MGKTRVTRPGSGKNWQPSPIQLEIYAKVCEGKTHRQIGLEHNLSHSHVTHIAGKVNNWLIPRWVERAETIKAQHTESLMHVFRESMAAWERSKQDARRRTVKHGKEGLERTRITKGQSGDPRHLQNAMQALEDIRKIWGANEPVKAELSGGIGVEHTGSVDVRTVIEELETQLGPDLEAIARQRAGLAIPGLSGAGTDGAAALSLPGAAARGPDGPMGNGSHPGSNGSGHSGH